MHWFPQWLQELSSGYAFVPPSAGSVLVANALGVNLGTMMAVGIPVALVSTVVAGIIWGKIIGNKIYTKLPANVEEIADIDKNLPSFGIVLTIILIPLILILLSTISGYLPIPESAQSVLQFLGEPFVALTIATLSILRDCINNHFNSAYSDLAQHNLRISSDSGKCAVSSSVFRRTVCGIDNRNSDSNVHAGNKNGI